MPTSRILPAVATAALLAGLLTACVPDPGSDPAPEPTGTGAATATPTATAGAGETPEPTTPPAPTLSADDRANLRDAIASGNTAAVEGYLADPVTVIIMSSECCWDIAPAEAVESLMYVTDAPGPWDWNLPASTIADWRTNQYYGDLFTGDDITGRAADGTVVNFGLTGDRVTTILMGFEEGFTY